MIFYYFDVDIFIIIYFRKIQIQVLMVVYCQTVLHVVKRVLCELQVLILPSPFGRSIFPILNVVGPIIVMVEMMVRYDDSDDEVIFVVPQKKSK